MSAKFKAIVPKKAKLDIKPMVKAVEKITNSADKQFGLTYKTWSDEHKPEFEKDVDVSAKKIVGSATTTEEGSKDNPYPFIAKGTDIRYATMTPDFVAKTKPRVIGSGQGRGGLAYVDTRKPRPGIESREYEPEIAKRLKPRFEKYGQEAMAIVAKKSGHQL